MPLVPVARSRLHLLSPPAVGPPAGGDVGLLAARIPRCYGRDNTDNWHYLGRRILLRTRGLLLLMIEGVIIAVVGRGRRGGACYVGLAKLNNRVVFKWINNFTSK